MNNRIFELAKEADLIRWDTLPSGAKTPDHESIVKAKKFAELIVRECMELNSGEMGFPAWQDLTRIYREHFGVKE